jgi:hypothetical protein
MATREQKMQVLINTLGFDEAMKLAPNLVDDAVAEGAAEKAAADEAELARAASKNPFIKGEHFNLAEQGRLFKNEKTRGLAVRLAAKAGLTLPENPSHRDLNAKAW